MPSFSIIEAIKFGFKQTWQHAGFFVKATLVPILFVAAMAGITLLFLPRVAVPYAAMKAKIQKEEAAIKEVRGEITQKHKEIFNIYRRFRIELILKNNWGWMLILGLMWIMVIVGLQLGIRHLSLNYYDSGKRSLADLFGALRLIPQAIGAGALIALAIMAIVFVWIAITIGIALLSSMVIMSEKNSALVVLFGAISLVIPFFLITLYYSVRFIFVLIALVDGHGIIGSFRKSWQLTRGNFWRMLGLMILLGMIASINILYIPIFIFPIQLALIRVYRELGTVGLDLEARIYEMVD